MTARKALRHATEFPETRPSASAAVRSLTLSHFRNYPSLKLEVTDAPVVLTGPNGAGKTNILEALSLLAPGRGLRGAKLEELDCHYENSLSKWGVHAVANGRQGQVELGTGVPDDASKLTRRIIKIDGKKTQQAALADKLSVLWVTPQMDGIFLESDTVRRKFLDRLAYGLDPSHAEHVSAYDHASRERMKLLEGGMMDDAWLSGLEREMATHALHMVKARLETVDKLNDAMHNLSPSFPRGVLKTYGIVETWLERQTPEEIIALGTDRLSRTRMKDAASGRLNEGLHRTALETQLSLPGTDYSKNARECSTGEQKALLLSVMLAGCSAIQQQTGFLPVLLLDEVVAHLDAGRRHALFDAISGLKIQAWMTGTDSALFSGFETSAQCLEVREGKVNK